MDIIDPDTGSRPVFVLSEHYEATDGHWHAHRRAQFIHASDGVLSVRTRAGLWVVPPQRAVWILPGETHKVSAGKSFMLRTLYAEPGLAVVPPACRVVMVDRLLDALLIEGSRFGATYPSAGPEQRLVAVILDRLSCLETTGTHLPAPADHRLLRLTEFLERHPTDPRTLGALAALNGMTARTAARLFIKETGLTFAQWRQQMRLLTALQSLALGESVTNVAANVGYHDVSAFISVFKLAFGKTPARYFRAA